MKRTLLLLAILMVMDDVSAVPQLSAQLETVDELSVRVLSRATGVPKDSLVGHFYEVTHNGEKKEVRWYAPKDIWRQRTEMRTWKDKNGNVQRLARVNGLLPSFERKHEDREKIEAALEESDKAFTGTEDERAAWKTCWGGNGKGRFFNSKNSKLYYVEFEFVEPVKDADCERLLKTFVGSAKVASTSATAKGSNGSMKWWTTENEQYKFMTDLSKSQGDAFVKNAMKLMSAMRKSYEFYVPAQKKVGVSTVRIFKSLSSYQEYRLSTGDKDTSSVGLWDPSREELLVASYGDREEAQETMRHEAFHQYLFYATGGSRHAMWFNEGHATFFEHIQHDRTKSAVRIIDKGDHAMWVERDPEQAARMLRSILTMGRETFYAENGSRVTVGDSMISRAYYHYVLAWALTYFLEKGVYTHDDFAAYRKVLPTYLEEIRNGKDEQTATSLAWEHVRDRDLEKDFLLFWLKHRNAARNIR